jgi:hypothetical protein
MSDAAWQLQRAVYVVLSNALTVPVYDHVPQDAALPYVMTGDDSARDWSADDLSGVETTLSIHVWSRYAGRREGKEIMAEIKRALHEQSVAPLGHRLVLLRWEFAASFLEQDGLTRHGVMRLRSLTHEED